MPGFTTSLPGGLTKSGGIRLDDPGLAALIDERVHRLMGVSESAMTALAEASKSGNIGVGLAEQIASKLGIPNGNSVQYVDGKGELRQFPNIGKAAQSNRYSDLDDKPELGDIAARSSSEFDTAGSSDAALASAVELMGHDKEDTLAKASSDASLKAQSARNFACFRKNHEGTQPISTIEGLSAVASTGRYSDLIDPPRLDYEPAGSSEQAEGRAVRSSIQEASEMDSKVKKFCVQRENHTGTQPASTVDGLSKVATSGSYGDLRDTPELGSIAFKEIDAFDPAGTAQKLVIEETASRHSEIQSLREELDKERARAQAAETNLINTIQVLIRKMNA